MKYTISDGYALDGPRFFTFDAQTFTNLSLNNTKPMNKLNSMMKRLLDADTQTLVKAGFINGDLELTNDGRNALWAIIFEQNKPALVAEATAKLAEEKK